MHYFYIFILIILIHFNIFPKVNDFQVLWLTGNIALLDFGMDVNAEGVYLKK